MRWGWPLAVLVGLWVISQDITTCTQSCGRSEQPVRAPASPLPRAFEPVPDDGNPDVTRNMFQYHAAVLAAYETAGAQLDLVLLNAVLDQPSGSDATPPHP